MGSFATNQLLHTKDLRLITTAADGDASAIVSICERFKIPTLAVLLKGGMPFAEAVDCVQPILANVCQRLVDGKVTPVAWAASLVRQARLKAEQSSDESNNNEPSSLSSFDSIPRIAKRRILNNSFSKLPLPELIALLMRSQTPYSIDQFVGIVADHESQAAEHLANAVQLVADEWKSEISET